MKLAILLCLFAPLLSSSVPCGTHVPQRGRFERHILGGNTVEDATKWPWQLFIHFTDQVGYTQKCGGTVISENWILTAAHCVINIFTDELFEEAVAYRGWGSDAVRKINISRIMAHANFTSVEKGDDIALLKIENPLIFDEMVSPICLVNSEQTIQSDGIAVITGYGHANERGTKNFVKDQRLRETIIPLIDDDICISRWEPIDSLTKTEEQIEEKRDVYLEWICAGSMDHSTAPGDSGGPLMMKSTDGRWFQMGITSWGYDPKMFEADLIPNIFTDIRPYCDWIEEITEGEAKCQEENVTLKDVEISP